MAYVFLTSVAAACLRYVPLLSGALVTSSYIELSVVGTS